MRFHVFEISAGQGDPYGGADFDDEGRPIVRDDAKFKICIKLEDIKSIQQIGFYENIPVPADPAIADNIAGGAADPGILNGINGAMGAFHDAVIARPAARQANRRPQAQPPRARQLKRYVVDKEHYIIQTANNTWTAIGKFDEFADILTQFQISREIA